MANSSRADPMQPKEGAPQPALPPLPSAARIQLYEVLNGETDPPFTFPAFVAYLNKQHAEENIEFYDAVVQYRKAARQLSHRIAQQQQQREASAAAAAAAALTSGQCAEPSPSSGSSSPTTAPQIPGNHGGKNSRRRRSSVFVSIAEMESQPILQSLASGISGRRGSIGFQNTMLFDSSLAALPNGSELKALLELQEGGSEGEDARILTERLGKLREKLERIVEIFLNEGAPKEINIPGNLRDQLLQEIRVNKNYDPRIFKPAMENLYNSMKGNLMGFRNEGEKLLKAARANAIKVEEDDRLVDEEENEAIPSFLAGPEEAKAVEVKRDQRRRMSTVPDFVRSGPGSSGSRAMPPPIAEMPSKQENPVTNKRK